MLSYFFSKNCYDLEIVTILQTFWLQGLQLQAYRVLKNIINTLNACPILKPILKFNVSMIRFQ